MSEAMKFQSKDLLTYADFEILITSPFPAEKADIIKKKMKNYILIIEKEGQKEKSYYRFDLENVLYHKEVYDENKIITSISLLLQQSFKALSDIEKELMMSKYSKLYRGIFKNSSVSAYLPQVRVFLTNYDIDFNKPHLNEIHFLNGYFNIKTNKFQSRIVDKHYISHFIKREYKEQTIEMKDKVYKDLKKIYFDEDDLNYLMMTYGIALTGRSTNEQTVLFLLGNGNSGKSTIIELIKLCCEDYIYTLPKQTFSKGYSKIDKVMNSYMKNAHIRLSHINEPEDVKIDESLFKDFTDGNIQSTSLFQDGSNDFTHNSKLVFTANTYPNIIVDSGTERRVDSYTHMSKFVKDKDLVDEEKHIYLGNSNFLMNAKKNENYLNAFFDILTEYAYNWSSKKNIYLQTENFKKTKNEVIINNDIIQDFIDKCIIITNNPKDKIGKNEMYDMFKEEYPKKYLTAMQLFNSLKQKNIEYNSNCRRKGIRGCYIGVKEKLMDDDDEEDEVMNQLYPQLSKMDKDKNKDNEIEKLQNKILELEEMLKNNKKKQMEENKRVMKPDNEKERLKEENKKVNECFMDAMDENKKLRKLLCKHNISYSYIDIKFNDIIDNIEENIEEDEVKPKEKTKEKSYGEEHAERQAVIIENERKKLKEQNKLLRKKEEKQKETKTKIDYDELIANNEVFNSIF